VGEAERARAAATAAADHQTHNARALADAGAAVLFAERDLAPSTLARLITDLLADRSRLAAIAEKARGRVTRAARDVVSRILDTRPKLREYSFASVVVSLY